jgi:hypothetical protein
MNKRIKELMIQCEKKYCQDHDDYFYDMEKFAELIVRECAELMYGRDENGNCKDGDMIKQHFGVEE